MLELTICKVSANGLHSMEFHQAGMGGHWVVCVLPGCGEMDFVVEDCTGGYARMVLVDTICAVVVAVLFLAVCVWGMIKDRHFRDWPTEIWTKGGHNAR